MRVLLHATRTELERLGGDDQGGRGGLPPARVQHLLLCFHYLIAWFYLGLQAYQNYVNPAYLWFLAGVAFKLPELARTRAAAGPTS